MEKRRLYSSSVFVVTDRGETLLILHNYHKKWLPIGGRHEPNETPLEAAIRELQEETGLVAGRDVVFPNICEAPRGTPAGFIGYEEHEGKGGQYLNFCFVARIAEPCGIQARGEQEYSAFEWFELGAWPEAAPSNVQDILLYIQHVCIASGSRFSNRQFFGV